MMERTDLIVVSVFAVLVVATVTLLLGSGEHKKFEEEWPPISDDEFMAKCSPGTSRDTALRVRRIISEQTGIRYECIHPNQCIVNDLG